MMRAKKRKENLRKGEKKISNLIEIIPKKSKKEEQ
jgi:hypothetical protein